MNKGILNTPSPYFPGISKKKKPQNQPKNPKKKRFQDKITPEGNSLTMTLISYRKKE